MKALAVLVFMLLVGGLVPPGRLEARAGEADVFVIDPDLREVLLDLDDGGAIEVIVHFDSFAVRAGALADAEARGDEVLGNLNALPVTLIRTDLAGTLDLSQDPRVSWMEHNSGITYDLEMSAGVIGAIDVWNRVPIYEDGPDTALNTLSMLRGIDGRDVTVAIVDTGVDAGHPDLDYGEKVVRNLHKNGPGDSDPWIEAENCDTSYGHGTHCAGIVGGNGDASGGQRKGVAPGATLIGVGGDWTPVVWAVLEGLEWVYENSRPGNNPDNIRVVSNSWGGAGAEYDPESAVSQMAEKLTYENNVVVVFAAGNAGDTDHDGSTITTSSQSNTPSVIGVAASERDGSGIAVFSSRGQKGLLATYPDVAAPGVDIWATTPRGTWLDIFQRTDEDLYYMAISGTSMATPHVSGLVALMWQACPSMNVSEHREDFSEGGNFTVDEWNSMDTTLIHEAEYILKMTADYIEPTDEAESDDVAANGVPFQFDDGTNGRRLDYAQGYGLVNATKAVGVCLALHRLRTADWNGDGRADDPHASVETALAVYEGMIRAGEVREEADAVTTTWRGEWAHFTNSTGNPTGGATYDTDQSHRVRVPEGASSMEVTLHWEPVDAHALTAGTIDVWMDIDGDGGNDLTSDPLDLDGSKTYEVDVDGGEEAYFKVEGQAAKVFLDNPDDEFPEPRMAYTISVLFHVEPGTIVWADPSYITSPYALEDTGGATSDAVLRTKVYDVGAIEPSSEDDEDFTGTLITLIVLALIACTMGGSLLLGLRMGRTLPKKR
ncbi:MAG: S8 family serine peptidase [Thermoplasmata archaeon]|nr:S8 family serine peptidase [Thermoplasmata archaeon]